MATISFDRQSLMVDGRRVWLVSGAIHYARVPRDLWRSRIRAAKQAGLNCIETYVFWNLHELAPGKFDFEGEKDLRAFIETIAEEGMYCFLRPGPYVGSEWDFGGLPGWLNAINKVQLREANEPFLEATGRYLRAVMEQVGELQLSEPDRKRWVKRLKRDIDTPRGGFEGNGGGPIILMQVENEWFCGNEEAGEAYFRSLIGQMRQHGCTVPITNCNNLWHQPNETMHTWNAGKNFATDLRQLALLQPDAPRLVSEYWTGWFNEWHRTSEQRVDAQMHLCNMAYILAAGAQMNLYMFHGGTNFGFTGGRTAGGPKGYITTSYDYDAPLSETGERGEKYTVTKRLAMFASQFGHVLASIAPQSPHVCLMPDENDSNVSISHLRGGVGDVVFLLRGEHHRAKEATLLLPNGLRLPVPLGRDRVAWVVLDTRLNRETVLDYTNLRPWAFVDDRMLILFGPAKATGVVALNDANFFVTVPSGKTPLVETHEEVTLVVLNEEQVDAAYLSSEGLVVGADGIDHADKPLPLKGWSTMHVIDTAGKATRRSATATTSSKPPKLEKWQAVIDPAVAKPDEAKFESIDGPAALEALGVSQGYGWYRIDLPVKRQGSVLPGSGGDRLHFYEDGKLLSVIGDGEGATDTPETLQLGKQVVVLADNLGRLSFGNGMGEAKGLADHLHEAKPTKLPKAKVSEQPAPDPFEVSGFILNQRRGGQRITQQFEWSLRLTVKQPLMLELHDLPASAVVRVNDQGAAYYDARSGTGRIRLILNPREEPYQSGSNILQLAFVEPLEKSDLARVEKCLTLYAINAITDGKTEWSFARWHMPDEAKFAEAPKRTTSCPTWFRCSFELADNTAPLWLEPQGMSKGQIFLNGHNLGRYWIATATGKAMPGQHRYYLPECWLRTNGPNELVLFDEHGRLPGKVGLAR